jgi:hypothetical protein
METKYAVCRRQLDNTWVAYVWNGVSETDLQEDLEHHRFAESWGEWDIKAYQSWGENMHREAVAHAINNMQAA